MGGQHGLLERFHRLGFVVGFVVVAQQMQHAVHDKQGELVFDTSAMVVLTGMLRRIGSSDNRADDDVTDQVVGMACLSPIKRKREHVGRAVLAAMFDIEFVDRGLIDEEQIALSRRHAL